MEGVYVIDGKSLSTGIGLQVLAACRMRDAGMNAAGTTFGHWIK